MKKEGKQTNPRAKKKKNFLHRDCWIVANNTHGDDASPHIACAHIRHILAATPIFNHTNTHATPKPHRAFIQPITTGPSPVRTFEAFCLAIFAWRVFVFDEIKLRGRGPTFLVCEVIVVGLGGADVSREVR